MLITSCEDRLKTTESKYTENYGQWFFPATLLLYQERPPPPPEPRPEEPPPERLPDEGLEHMVLLADCMVERTKEPKARFEKLKLPEYQPGGGMAMLSNFLIHVSDNSKT